MGACVGKAARVRDAGKIFAILFQVRDGILRTNEYDDGVATFFGFADAQNLDAAGMRRQAVVVTKHICIICELFGRADVMAEHVLGGRHTGAGGKMVNQRAQELRLGGPFLDARRVIRVHCLGPGRRLSWRREGKSSIDCKQNCGTAPEH